MRFTEILTKKINRNGAIAHKRSFTHEKKCSIAPKPCNKKIEIAKSCGIKNYRPKIQPPTCCTTPKTYLLPLLLRSNEYTPILGSNEYTQTLDCNEKSCFQADTA